jgi:hypothetical protein
MWFVDPYREYQDYIMAYRLRKALGYVQTLYTLADYAALRLRRGELIQKLIARQGDPLLLARIEQITEDLNYGFWSNPGILKGFLQRIGSGYHPTLSSPENFEELLSPSEHRRIHATQVGEYYLGWLRLPGLVNEPIAFEYCLQEQERLAEHVGLFLDEFNTVAS